MDEWQKIVYEVASILSKELWNQAVAAMPELVLQIKVCGFEM